MPAALAVDNPAFDALGVAIALIPLAVYAATILFALVTRRALFAGWHGAGEDFVSSDAPHWTPCTRVSGDGG